MIVYAESSAVLAWLLGEPHAGVVRACLAGAQLVVASDLTLVECDRVLTRAVTLGDLAEAEAAGRRAELNHAAAHWAVLRLSPDVIDRARERFPEEPVRTLDALHLSSALVAKGLAAHLSLLSLDDRVRANGRALGFDLQPPDPPASAGPA